MIFASLPTNKYKTVGEEFKVEDDLYLEFCECYPEVDIIGELLKMRAWLICNDQKRKTKRGMKRFINSWLSRAQENLNSRNANDLAKPMHPWIGRRKS